MVGGDNNCSSHTGGHILGSNTNSISAHAFHTNRLFLSAGALLTSDPGIAGQVYLSGGGAAGYALMISNP